MIWPSCLRALAIAFLLAACLACAIIVVLGIVLTGGIIDRAGF